MSVSVRVIVSGLTAAGKTTHAKLLASHFDVPYVAMLPIMTAVLRERHPNADFRRAWTPDRDRVRADDDQVDLEADRRMRAAIADGPGVFDAWALPWLYAEQDAVRVWIESDVSSRNRKCIVSALMQDEPTPDDPAELVRLKDKFSTERFQHLYGFELSPAPSIFDVIADNSEFIAEPTVACAERGIAAFHPQLVRAIEQHLAV